MKFLKFICWFFLILSILMFVGCVYFNIAIKFDLLMMVNALWNISNALIFGLCLVMLKNCEY